MVNRITACKDSDKYARYSVGTVRSFEPDAHSVLSFEPDADETAELDTNGVIRLFLHSHDSAESDGEDFDDCDELVNSDDCEALVDRGATDLEELFWEPTKKTWNAEWSDPYAWSPFNEQGLLIWLTMKPLFFPSISLITSSGPEYTLSISGARPNPPHRKTAPLHGL
jgi:hypothetical protein